MAHDDDDDDDDYDDDEMGGGRTRTPVHSCDDSGCPVYTYTCISIERDWGDGYVYVMQLID